MNDRIKKFYQDNKETVHVAAVAIAGVTTAVVLAKLSSGKEIATVHSFDDTSGVNHIIVGLKNGTSRAFYKNPPTE